ncbi:MAG: sugar kinase [Ginsengibacter sp.]
MSKVLCFGELLLRYSPELNGRWINSGNMPVHVGGAELNAASALAHFNVPVDYMTVLPDNYLVDEILNWIKSRNIGINKILRQGARIGSYYLPDGADLKHKGVIYDRDFSSFSQIKTGQLDWNEILKDISWFHFSAISPALNYSVAQVCLEALEAASKRGIKISVDLNYRSKLWNYGKQPVDIMPALVEHCDVIMGNIWAHEIMLGIPISIDHNYDKTLLLEQSALTSAAICKRFNKCSQVASTFRFNKDNGVNYYATLYKDDKLSVSKEFSTDTIIDQIGTGDTFMAGLIYCNLNKLGAKETIQFSDAAAFNKLFIKGDASNATIGQVKKHLLSE